MLDRFVTSKPNFVDMMTQCGTEEVYSTTNTKSSNLKLLSEQPNATSIELLGHQTLIVTHVVVSMNFNRR
jgi:hypothetical protein